MSSQALLSRSVCLPRMVKNGSSAYVLCAHCCSCHLDFFDQALWASLVLRYLSLLKCGQEKNRWRKRISLNLRQSSQIWTETETNLLCKTYAMQLILFGCLLKCVLTLV